MIVVSTLDFVVDLDLVFLFLDLVLVVDVVVCGAVAVSLTLAIETISSSMDGVFSVAINNLIVI